MLKEQEMSLEPEIIANVKQAVPFFRVADMDASYRFYVDGLAFTMTKHWIVDNMLRWCWLEIGDAAIMLQDMQREDGVVVKPEGKLGEGVSISFQCLDALAIYRDALARGIQATRPFVGNGMWVTTVIDPDGYVLEFESFTDAPEESEYTES